MSENQLPPDDPRLTAYALGELDPTEEAVLEQLLFDSPEAQAAVREIRELAGLLTTELRQEPALELTAQQRAAILVAGGAAAQAVPEPVNHAANNSNEMSVLLGLPDPPAPLRARKLGHSVRRFASLATIAALIVVAAIVIPPPRPQGESTVMLAERGGDVHDLATEFDSLSTEGLAMPESKGLASDVTVLSDGVVRFHESADSGLGFGEGEQRIAGRQARLGAQRSNQPADSAPPVPPGTHLVAGSGGRGRGFGNSSGKPIAPQDGEDANLYYLGAGLKPQQGLGPQSEGKPAAGMSVATSSGRKSGGVAGSSGGRAGGGKWNEESAPDGSKVVAVDRLRSRVRKSMYRAEGLAQTNPAAARKLIEDAETDVKNSTGVDGKTSGQLLKSLAKSRESIDLGKKLAGSNELARRKLALKGEVNLQQRTESRLEDSLAENVDAYNKLLKENRFDDAIEVGKRVQAQMPDNPLPELMVAKARYAKQGALKRKPAEGNPDPATEPLAEQVTDQAGDVRVESVPELGILIITGNQSDVEAVQDVVQEVERLSRETAGVEYPTEEKWKKLTELRRSYKRPEAPGTEVYEPIVENQFFSAYEDPLSTFGVDVDTASYSNVRRFLTDRQLPPPNAVRIEELVNYFSYDYPQPAAGQPFSVNVEAGNCPWAPGHQLVRIALKGREIPRDQRPASNLVFLVDVSGSMQAENKLPLVKLGLNLLTQQMTESDRVAIVTYSDSAVQRLESTNGTNKQQITQVIDSLQAAGSTNGAAGIQLAYRAALDHFIDGGTNRVILCTDGDFNVGVSDDNELVKMIQERARTKVFFSVFGFGMDNLKDGKLEKLADKGNGHYAYIDGQREAQKMFVDELVSTLVTIAKDVKLQVEFNPNQVGAYRLVGYENRVMAAQDFSNDKKDAGEIGAGHTVTALYEIVPAAEAPRPQLGDSLRYRKAVVPQDGDVARELLTVKLRYKLPEADTSTLVEYPAAARGIRPAGVADQPDAPTTWYAMKLQRTDPDAAAKSLRALFGSNKAGRDKDALGNEPDAPAIEADAANGRLLVRGSPEQISQARQALADLGETGNSASPDFNWAAAVAAFGMILRDSQFRGHANFDMVLELAQSAKGEDKSGRRAEFIELVKTAKSLFQPVTPVTSPVEPAPALTREQAEAKASMNGKYKNLLRIIPAPGDATIYGAFNDNGHWEGTSYLGHDNLPAGYWVYVAPNWYIWGDK